MNWDSVLQETQLFQPFTSFQRRFRGPHKEIERRLPVSVQAEVLEVPRVVAIAVERNGGPGKIKSTALCLGHNLNCVWITDLMHRAKGFQGSHFDQRVFHYI